MKSKNLVRAISTLLAMLMVLSLAACGSKTGDTPAPAPENPSNAQPADGAGSGSNAPDALGDFPNQEITYLVCFTAGGESDVTARIQQKYFEKYSPVGFHIEYLTGGNGATGWVELNRRAPDGYTIAGCNEPHTIIQPMMNDTGFTTDGFERICLFQYTGRCLLVPANSPFDTLEEMTAYAKDNPGKLTIGSSGMWSAGHLACLELMYYSDVEYTYISYEGNADGKADLLGSHIDGYMANVTEAIELGDQVKCLAVAREERHEQLPDVPTFTELGYPIMEGSYRGVMAPKGTPEEIVEYLADIFKSVNEDPGYIEEMTNLGYDFVYMDPDEYDEFLVERAEVYAELVKIFE